MIDTSGPEDGLEVVMRVSQAHRRELLQTLEGLHATLTGEGKVSSCDLFEDALTPNRLFWMEWWSSESEVEASLHSGRFTTLMEAVRLLGKLETVRRVHCRECSGPELATTTSTHNSFASKGGDT